MTPEDFGALARKRVFFSQLDGVDKLDDVNANYDAGYNASVAALAGFGQRYKDSKPEVVSSSSRVPVANMKFSATNRGATSKVRKTGTSLSSWNPAARPLPRAMSFVARRREEDRLEALKVEMERAETAPEKRFTFAGDHNGIIGDDETEVIIIEDTQLPTTGIVNKRPMSHGQAYKENALLVPVITIAHTVMDKTQQHAPIHSNQTKSLKAVVAPATGKRKRDAGPRQVPLKLQVLKGLSMMSIPNNDINKARALRMSKVVEYGAEWARDFNDKVTHIIADKDVTLKDVLNVLKLEKLPEKLVVVKENYTADCITWRALMDPDQPRYRVKGAEGMRPAFPALPAPPAAKHASEQSDASLEPKSAKRAKVNTDGTVETHTQSRTDESSAKILSLEQIKTPRVSLGRSLSPRIFNGTDVQQNDCVTTTNTPDDGLNKAIVSARPISHLLSDSEDDDASQNGTSFGTDFDSDSRHSPEPKKTFRIPNKNTNDPTRWVTNLQCMDPGKTKTTENPNSKTIAILQEMENYYSSIRDEWRCRAYRQAICQLQKQNHHITTKEEAGSFRFIGERLAAKIEEIVSTNKLQRLEHAKMEPTDQAIGIFVKIYGVGFRQASKWVQQGYRTLKDLLTSPNVKLTENQKIGIKHYEDFKLRIPRPETRQLAAIIKQALKDIDPRLEMMVGGSYRRGAPDSRDIDVIITKADADADFLRQTALKILIPHLTAIGFLTAGLAVMSKDDGSKWHGACQLPSGPHPESISLARPNDSKTNTNPWRRIDFLLVPWDEMGAALIYFTGNDIFNRSMRLLARKKGWRLNQRGLYKDVMRKGPTKLNEGTKISGHSEREIFELLGVPWRAERSRNC